MTFPEFLYYIGYLIKKHYALKNLKRLPHKVISIGNITLGGTGKTPAGIALAREAIKREINPCILTRGYKGKAKGPCFVSRGEDPLLDEHQAGDEALLMAKKLKDVPIVKGKNRYEAGMFALNSLPLAQRPNLFILDDGFQHWHLFRDKDIVLIDSVNPFGNRMLFPLGSLRESLVEMRRADIIVITNTLTPPSPLRGEGKGGGVDNLISQIRQYNTSAPIFFAQHKPSEFIKMTGDKLSIEWAKDKKFFGFCGIGNPDSFRKTLLSLDIDLKGFKIFKDHHRYSPDDIKKFINQAKISNAQWIVTTEKDIIRLKGFDVVENLVSLAIEFTIDEGFYDAVFGTFVSK
jgi:tetraacyldisaccharide 4'-kinase